MRLEQGCIRESDVSLHQVVSILQPENSANPLDIAAVLNSLAVVQQMSGDFFKAAALVRKVVHICRNRVAAEAVDLGAALSNLAIMLRYVGNQPGAVTAAERAGSILGPQPQGRTDSRPGIHPPRSIDQELDHLTKDLELPTNQRKQVRPLLDEHHDIIQVLFEKNPTISHEDLGPQIHAISDETHHQIEVLLTGHQKELANAIAERVHDGEEQTACSF